MSRNEPRVIREHEKSLRSYLTIRDTLEHGIAIWKENPSWNFTQVEEWFKQCLDLYDSGHYTDIAVEQMEISVDETVRKLTKDLEEANLKIKTMTDNAIADKKQIRGLQIQLGKFAKMETNPGK